ncbi:MAG: hypothetical protein JWM46_403 [Candidatus Kaiserbacteria bacterium]|nr:hypothetical protein [Candidatus Kaiserbacteria bacterium]
MKGLSVFQIVLVAVFGALAIAAVLIFAFAVGGNTSTSVGAVKIWGTVSDTAFNSVIRQATETNAQLSLVTYIHKDPDTFISDLTNALASGTGPDLVLLPQDAAYAQANKLIPIPYTTISKSQFQNTFVEAANPFLATSGVLGVPLLVDPLVLYWNKDMLATGGIAQPPQYWDQLYDMAAQITKRDQSSGSIIKSLIDFGEYSNVQNAKDVISMLILQAGGMITGRESDTGAIVSSLAPKTGDATQATPAAVRFYTEFADPSKPDYSWSRSLGNSRQEFAAGDLALYVGYASELPLIKAMNPNLNFSPAPIPQIRNGPRSTNFGRVYAFVIPKTSSNPTGASIVESVLTAADLSTLLSTGLGIPSARRDVLAAKAVGDFALFNKQAIIARSWVDPDPTKTAQIFRDMIENTTSGASLLSEAVQRADQEMQQLLSQ